MESLEIITDDKPGRSQRPRVNHPQDTLRDPRSFAATPGNAGASTDARRVLAAIHRSRAIEKPPGRQKAAEIGFLPEERGLYPGMSVLQTVVYFGRLKGLSRSASQSAAASLIERFGLAEFRNHRVDRLSKGVAQKVQLATALVNSPKLLLLDEPFSGLDPVNQAVLQDEILATSKAGSTILFSTHVMEHAERLCTRLLILAHGQKLFDGSQEGAKAMLPSRLRLRARSDPSSLPGVATASRCPSSKRAGPTGRLF